MHKLRTFVAAALSMTIIVNSSFLRADADGAAVTRNTIGAGAVLVSAGLCMFHILFCKPATGVPPVAKTWFEVLFNCKGADPNTQNHSGSPVQMAYWNASDSLGPGTVWDDDPNKALSLLGPLPFMLPAQTTISVPFAHGQSSQVPVTVDGAATQCSANYNINWAISSGLPINIAQGDPVGVKLEQKSSSAQSINVTIGSYVIDTLNTGLYQEATDFFELTPSQQRNFFDSTKFPNAKIVVDAIKVHNLVVTIKFSATDFASLQADFGNGKTIATGSGGANVAMNISEDGTVSLTVPGDMYVAGHWRPASEFPPTNGSALVTPLAPGPAPAPTPTPTGLLSLQMPLGQGLNDLQSIPGKTPLLVPVTFPAPKFAHTPSPGSH